MMHEHQPTQARFVGNLAMVLFALAVASAALLVVIAMGSQNPPLDLQETPPAVDQAAEPVPSQN